MSSSTVPPALQDTSAIRHIYGAHPFRIDGDLLALAFAPDGTLWSVEDAGVLRHWELTGQRQLGWHHLEELATLWCFRADAKYVAAGSDELTLWDVQSGEAVTTWPQAEWITALAIHPHLGLIATGHDTRRPIRSIAKGSANAGGPVRFQQERRKQKRVIESVVRVWDVKKKQPIHEFRAHQSAISALAFSVDGTKLATAGEDRAIQLWDLDKGVTYGSLIGHTDRIPALAWHPDGKRLVSAGWDTTARVWHAQTCEPIILLNSHAPQVHTLAFNPDGTRLACADSANAIHIWDMDRYRNVQVLRDQGNEIRCLAFSPDGRKLAFGGVERLIHVWDERQQQTEDAKPDSLSSRPALAVQAGGKQLASLGAGTSLRVWDVGSGDSVLSLEGAGALCGFAASADGAWFAASLAEKHTTEAMPTLGLWHAATGKRHRMLEGPKPPITALAFSPDSTLLAASGYRSADLWLWKVPSDEPALLIPNVTDGCSVEALAWHPQGRILACAGIDWLSTSGSDGRVTLWDVSQRQQVTSFQGGATALAFHPSGKKLAAATLKHTVRVWEIESEEPALELIGHFDAVTCLAYSSDGQILATGSDDHTVRLWDAESGLERGLIELDTQIKALAFSPDGNYLYTGNGNTSCYQLDVRQIPREV